MRSRKFVIEHVAKQLEVKELDQIYKLWKNATRKGIHKHNLHINSQFPNKIFAITITHNGKPVEAKEHRCLTAPRLDLREGARFKSVYSACHHSQFACLQGRMEDIGISPLPQEETINVEPKSPHLTVGNSHEDIDIDDLYTKYKKLQRQLEFLEVQESYIKDEQRNLKKEYLHAQEEVKRIQSVPLVIGQFLEAVDQNTGIVGSTTGSNYYVRILSTIDRELLRPSSSVALHKHSNALVDVLPPEADSSISMLQADEKPDVSYSDIGV
ncbi:26S protease regulatory subunit 6B [Orchesella cincta]|uniref:26S protease regulatory subunit 6B n=1 Tax=Orchesella cincta TaxID=48709 RepID=A0A1D2MP41_ORCCI|nr:26S protease regulatory subunit 6B [Orchesella cincta]